jgi:outer membrane protein OmpA-like peptidoglycan-associated protein
LFASVQWRDIEQKIANNNNTALQQNGVNWAHAETFNHGRDVLLMGLAPNADAVEHAKQLSLQANGTRTVEFVGDIEEAVIPAKLDISWEGKDVILSGAVDSPLTIKQLITKATQVWPNKSINNKLKVGHQTPPLEKITDAFIMVEDLSDGDSISFSQEQVSLSGNISTQWLNQKIESELGALFTLPIRNDLLVTKLDLIPPLRCEELIQELLAKTKIHFSSGNAFILEDSHSLLQNIADTINACPHTKFNVIGHTDSKGDSSFNHRLSEKRAASVVEKLIEFGVNTTSLIAKGEGNRRIEFVIKK